MPKIVEKTKSSKRQKLNVIFKQRSVCKSATSILNQVNFVSDVRRSDYTKCIVVAHSGGPDSTALLSSLSRLPKNYYKVVAVHIVHNMRSKKEQEHDLDIASKSSRDLGIDFFVKTITPEENKKLTENYFRNKRYNILYNMCKSLDEYYSLYPFIKDFTNRWSIATGHHSDDQLESILISLARGCGLSGLSGINPVLNIRGENENSNFLPVIRPMLHLDKQDTIEICEENNLEYALDATNENTKYTRNKIRHKVIPILKEINPKILTKVNQTAKICDSANECISKQVDDLQSSFGSVTHENFECSLGPLQSQTDIFLMYWLRKAALSIDGCNKIDKINYSSYIAAISDIRAGFGMRDWPGNRRIIVLNNKVTMRQSYEKE